MEFTKKDRDFIMKIASANTEFQKEFGARLKAVEDKVGVSAPAATLSPIQPSKNRVRKVPVKSRIPFVDDAVEGADSIEITFRNGKGDMMKQRMLIETLYKTMKELCDKNDIERLLIRLDEKSS